MSEIEGNVAPLVKAPLNPICILEAYSSLDIVLADSQQLDCLYDLVAKPMIILSFNLPALVLTLLGKALRQMLAHQFLAVAPQPIGNDIEEIAHAV